MDWTLTMRYDGDTVRTAFHEAAHAVGAAVLGVQIESASIKWREESVGRVWLRGLSKTTSYHNLQITYAGGFAAARAAALYPELSISESDLMSGARGDVADMVDVCRRELANGASPDRVLDNIRIASRSAAEMVKERWGVIQCVARMLVERETLRREEVEAICERAGALRGTEEFAAYV